MKPAIVTLIAFVSVSSLLLQPRKAKAEPNALGTEASAQLAATPDPSRRLLTAADTDQDGDVSLRELETVVSRTVRRRVLARFKQLDRNRDGVVTRAETPKMPGARFDRFDVNDDGAITQGELGRVMAREASVRLAQRFAELDANGDDRCTLAELGAARRAPNDDPGAPALASDSPRNAKSAVRR